MGKKTMDGLILANVRDFAEYLAGLPEDQEVRISRRRDPANIMGHVKRWAGMRKIHAIPRKIRFEGKIVQDAPGKG